MAAQPAPGPDAIVEAAGIRRFGRQRVIDADHCTAGQFGQPRHRTTVCLHVAEDPAAAVQEDDGATLALPDFRGGKGLDSQCRNALPGCALRARWRGNRERLDAVAATLELVPAHVDVIELAARRIERQSGDVGQAGVFGLHPLPQSGQARRHARRRAARRFTSVDHAFDMLAQHALGLADHARFERRDDAPVATRGIHQTARRHIERDLVAVVVQRAARQHRHQ